MPKRKRMAVTVFVFYCPYCGCLDYSTNLKPLICEQCSGGQKLVLVRKFVLRTDSKISKCLLEHLSEILDKLCAQKNLSEIQYEGIPWPLF